MMNCAEKRFCGPKAVSLYCFFSILRKVSHLFFSPASTKYTLAKQQACSNGCSSNIT